MTIIAQVLISSLMQGYYKAQLGDADKDTEEILNKKNFWAKIGEPIFILCVFIFGVLFCLGITLIYWIKK